MKMFITFGPIHLDRNRNSLGKSYMIVEGSDHNDIRSKTLSIRGTKFAFDYPVEELEIYEARHGKMTEVTQEDATILEIINGKLEDISGDN